MSRRHARETAMQYLYRMEMTDFSWEQIEPDISGNQDLSASESEYVKTIVQGVCRNRERIDALLSQYLKNWTLDRIPKVDLAILRLGIYEIARCDDIPPGATINECVDMAKAFSTPKSSAFINGILANYLRSSGKGAKKPQKPEP
ncbi:MAG: transcription antitermination factor NusB [Christensenellales bacterium]